MELRFLRDPISAFREFGLSFAAITSAQDGYWDVGSTWTEGNVPTINDDVTINHVVTIRDENPVCLSFTVSAGKQLIFECSGGATKTSFKDDANAKIVNNGTITIQNTTATKKCTWAGGSSANKVDWQKIGTMQPAHYWHWEYIKISDSTAFGSDKQIFIDKDIQTDSFNLTWSGKATVAAGVTWTVGHSGEDGVDQIWLERGSSIIFNGTPSSGITLRGTSSTERASRFLLEASHLEMHYVSMLYFKGFEGIIKNTAGGNVFIENLTLDGSSWALDALLNNIGSFAVLKDCAVAVNSETPIVQQSGHLIVEGGNYNCSTYWVKIFTGYIDLIGSITINNRPLWRDPDRSHRTSYYKKLTLTVQTGATPLQNAYCSLIQDHAEDYHHDAERPQEFEDAGVSNVNGQVILKALWKTEDEDGVTIYYSDENNNGPSGSPEEHLLKITKEQYWPSQNKSYYMNQDRTDTVTLIPYETPGAGERIVKFGTFQFPHALHIARLKKRKLDEKFIPDRAIAYRKDIGGYGKSWRISGYIETDIWNTVAQIENLADGVARSLDLGTGEALVNCILQDPDFAEDVDRYGRLDYTATLLEQSNP